MGRGRAADEGRSRKLHQWVNIDHPVQQDDAVGYGVRMSPRPSQRDALLDAFAHVVVEDGERGATLEAVAERAGVTKGGLLYHFPSREALVDGLIDRIRTALDADLDAMRHAPEGPVAYHLRTSVPGDATDELLDRLVTAAGLLAGSGRHPAVADAVRRAQARWYELLVETVDDPAVARVVTLVADGLWFTPRTFAPVEGSDPRSAVGIDDVVAVVERLTRPGPDPR